MYDAYIKASPVTQLIWGMMGTQPFLATDAPKLAPQGGALGGLSEPCVEAESGWKATPPGPDPPPDGLGVTALGGTRASRPSQSWCCCRRKGPILDTHWTDEKAAGSTNVPRRERGRPTRGAQVAHFLMAAQAD